MSPSDDDLDAFAHKLQSMGAEPPPAEMKRIVYRLFEGQQFLETAVGKLMGEVSTLSGDSRLMKLSIDKMENTIRLNAEGLRDVKLRFRNSQRKLEELDGEIGDTKNEELKTLRADRRRLAWIIVGTLVAGIVGFFLRQLLPR